MTMQAAILAALGKKPRASATEDETKKTATAPDETEAMDEEEDESAPAAEGEDEDETTMEEDEDEAAPTNPVAAKGYKRGLRHGAEREKARIGAILTAPEATANATLAAHLAFKTGMSAKEALSMLKASTAPGAASGGLAAKMAAQKQPKLGGSGSKGAALSQPERIQAAANEMIARKKASARRG